MFGVFQFLYLKLLNKEVNNMSKVPVFSINEFKKPKVLENVDADIQLIYYIIVGRADSSVIPDLKYDINRYRFENLIDSKSEIESSLRNHITRIAPEIYLDSIDISRILGPDTRATKALHFTINVINQKSKQRNSIFFKISKKDQNYLLVEIL
jgi:predicted RNA-binding protein YlqC (UPF0109 family)